MQKHLKIAHLWTDRLLRPGGGGRGRGMGGRGFGGGVQFSKRLDFGGSILKMHKMLGGRNIKTQGWPSR